MVSDCVQHLGGEDLSSEEVEDGVDAEAVGHEHGDDDDEGEEAEEGVGGEEEVLPVGEGGHGASTKRQDGGAGAVDVATVARPQGCRGAGGHHHPAGGKSVYVANSLWRPRQAPFPLLSSSPGVMTACSSPDSSNDDRGQARVQGQARVLVAARRQGSTKRKLGF